MRVFYLCKELNNVEGNKKELMLSDYNILNEGNLVVVLRLQQGPYRADLTRESWSVKDVDVVHPEKLEIIPSKKFIIDPDVELSPEPDIITFEDDPGAQRARMPCGHAIGAESLTEYCRSVLLSGKLEFRCPHMNPEPCDELWEFSIVKKCAALTAEEQREFETKLSMNYLSNFIGMQQCLQCQSFCARVNEETVRTLCLVCTKKGNSAVEFCWSCRRTWQTSISTDCGNFNCPSEDPRKKILRECKEKEISGINCPTIRACPKCGLMIEHIDGCKQMQCTCKQKFCFLCLQMANNQGAYICGSTYNKCEKAPAQVEIP
ncbi:uncharacterized protein LOC127721492 isoform X2 [Mytilus californianus]|nr:uncharacterized protein LOC127721492 isoform X2 [Mytilus californianus]